MDGDGVIGRGMRRNDSDKGLKRRDNSCVNITFIERFDRVYYRY